MFGSERAWEDARQHVLECVRVGLVSQGLASEVLAALEIARDKASEGGGRCKNCRFKTPDLSFDGLCSDCREQASVFFKR